MTQRIAVVTGAYRGLGFETCRQLAQKSIKVILTARSLEKAQDAAKKLQEEGFDVVGMALDVASDESVASFFTAYRDTYPQIDILVNNAGAIFEKLDAPIFSVSPEVLAQAFQTNTLSAYRTIQEALPMMNKAGYGRIVNVSSGMGGIAEMGGGYPAYRLSKASLNALTKVFDAEASSNVKINSVCPGWVKTDMGGPNAPRSVEEGAASIVWAAILPDDGPSGGFYRDGAVIAW